MPGFSWPRNGLYRRNRNRRPNAPTSFRYRKPTEPAPKRLIDRLRALQPEALLVGFKLSSGLAEEGMLAAARALLERARLDAVLVNDAARTGEDDHEALLVSATEILARCRGKERIAQAVTALLAGRAGAATP